MIEAAIHSSATQQFEDKGKKHPRVDDSADSEAELQYSGELYVAHKGSLYVWKNVREGHKVPIRIANFVAHIAADHVADDGTEQFRMFTARHSRNQTLMAFPFPYDDWLFEN